jgi:hypothetical protein
MEILRGRQGQLGADELGPGLPDEGDLVVEDVIFVADKDNQAGVSSARSAWKVWIIVARTKVASVRANWAPIHTRGPMPNGR